MNAIKKLTACLLPILFIGNFQSCAPVFSDLQSARLVGKGNFELTPGYTSTSASVEGETEGIQNHIGLQFAYGLSEKVDLRGRFEHIWLKNSSEYNAQIFGIGPKISLVKDRLAAYIPIGLAVASKDDFVETNDTWEIIPTLLFTAPIIQDNLEVNPSAKYGITLCENCDDFFAFNIGLGISENLSRWAIRPEYGLLYFPGEDGHYGQFSIGFSFIINKLSAAE